MFKRLLAFFLVIVSIFFGVISVSADSYNSTWLDLMAYGGINDSGSFSVDIAGNSTSKLRIPIPKIGLRYFELQFAGSFDVSVIFDGASPINLYESSYSTGSVSFISGRFTNRLSDYISLSVKNLSGSSQTFTIIKFVGSTLFYSGGFNVPVALSGRDWAGQLFATNFPEDNPAMVNLGTGSGTPGQRGVDVQLYIEPEDWVNFDEIRIFLDCNVASITGFYAQLNDYPLPITYDIENPSSYEGHFYVGLSIHIDNVVKSSFTQYPLKVYFSCVYNTSGSHNTIGIVESLGLYVSEESDQTFFSYWFGQIRDGIAGIFSGLGNWFSQLFGKLSDGFQSVVDAIVGDSKENEEMENEASDQEQALGDLNSSLNDYEKPDPGSMNIDIQVDPVGLGFISGGLGGIYQSSIFGQILTMIGILGLAGYVFFGKR